MIIVLTLLLSFFNIFGNLALLVTLVGIRVWIGCDLVEGN